MTVRICSICRGQVLTVALAGRRKAVPLPQIIEKTRPEPQRAANPFLIFKEDIMTRFLSVPFAALVLIVGVLPASADPPNPAYYSVVQNGTCWLPDGEAKSTHALSVKQAFRWVAPLQLEAFCRGQLPKDAPRPKEAMKISYEDAGNVCEIQFQHSTFRTANYGATVYPNGVTEIACRVDLD